MPRRFLENLGGNILSLYSGNSHRNKQRGEYFGEIEFFSEQPRTASAKSITFSNVFILSKQEFLTTMDRFYADKVPLHFCSLFSIANPPIIRNFSVWRKTVLISTEIISHCSRLAILAEAKDTSRLNVQTFISFVQFKFLSTNIC